MDKFYFVDCATLFFPLCVHPFHSTFDVHWIVQPSDCMRSPYKPMCRMFDRSSLNLATKANGLNFRNVTSTFYLRKSLFQTSNRGKKNIEPISSQRNLTVCLVFLLLCSTWYLFVMWIKSTKITLKRRKIDDDKQTNEFSLQYRDITEETIKHFAQHIVDRFCIVDDFGQTNKKKSLIQSNWVKSLKTLRQLNRYGFALLKI